MRGNSAVAAAHLAAVVPSPTEKTAQPAPGVRIARRTQLVVPARRTDSVILERCESGFAAIRSPLIAAKRITRSAVAPTASLLAWHEAGVAKGIWRGKSRSVCAQCPDRLSPQPRDTHAASLQQPAHPRCVRPRPEASTAIGAFGHPHLLQGRPVV